jgi:hypothetical protein
MGMRALVCAMVVLSTLVVTGAPAVAQSYPPPQNSITVDDPAPAAGQVVTVTLRTCRKGTRALFGLDLLLLGSARVDRNGVARGRIRIPTLTPLGRHAVVGACVGASGRPLVLHTDVRVVAGAGPSGRALPPGSAGGGGGAAAPPMPSLAGLGGGAVPANAPTLFGEAGAAIGVPEGGSPADPAAPGTDPAGAGAGTGTGEEAAAATGARGTSGEMSLASTLARVGLGLAAIFGVPVALAVSRRPRRTTRRRFA